MAAFKKHFWVTVGLISFIAIFISSAGLVLAWDFQEPQSAPPGGNPAPPLDVSDQEQTKEGNLNVSSVFSAGRILSGADNEKLIRVGGSDLGVQFLNNNIANGRIYLSNPNNLEIKVGENIALQARFKFISEPNGDGEIPDSVLLLGYRNNAGGLKLDNDGKLKFRNDGGEWTDIGVGQGGGESLWQAVAGNEIYYSGGNVGIGTNDPAFPLDVNGIARFGTAAITNNASIGTTAGGAQLVVRGQNGGGEDNVLRLMREGVDYSSYVQMNVSGRSVLMLNGNPQDNWVGMRIGDANNAEKWFVGGNGGKLLIRRNGESNDVVIADNGNVGIGAATPAVKLDVNGAVRVGAGQSNGIMFGGDPAGGDRDLYKIYAVANTLVYGSSTPGNGTKHGFLGNVGIGTTTPTEKLTVFGGNAKIQNGNLQFASDYAGSPSAITTITAIANGQLARGTYNYLGTYVTVYGGETAVSGQPGVACTLNQAGKCKIYLDIRVDDHLVSRVKIYRTNGAADNIAGYHLVGEAAGFVIANLQHDGNGYYVEDNNLPDRGNLPPTTDTTTSGIFVNNQRVVRFHQVGGVVKVGINTDAPQYTLDVNGSIRFSGGSANINNLTIGTSDNNNNGIFYVKGNPSGNHWTGMSVTDTNNTEKWFVGNNDNQLVLRRNGGNNAAGGTGDLMINSDGIVGINVANFNNPGDAKLIVNGGIKANTATIGIISNSDRIGTAMLNLGHGEAGGFRTMTVEGMQAYVIVGGGFADELGENPPGVTVWGTAVRGRGGNDRLACGNGSTERLIGYQTAGAGIGGSRLEGSIICTYP
ncbi:MAG: hypothetical protein Q8L36_00535 [bacterium]|nr:hypothetical protein [bacterium]